jgi:hypothetical protein
MIPDAANPFVGVHVYAGGLKSYVHRYSQAMRQLVLAGGDCAINQSIK